MRRIWLSLGLILTGASATEAAAQASPAHGTMLEILVHGAALERNALRIPADRAVSVYLPPSYSSGARRYPVVYLLHGIMDSHQTWTKAWGPPHEPHPGYATIAELMDQGIARGVLQEMIVVMPDADKTCHYTDTPVKGGWATFVAKDLVQYIDRTYRTVAEPRGRGILGHSMGGHGALKLAMVHPGVFSAVYAMNPSMLGWGGDVAPENPALRALVGLTTPAQLASANFYAQAVVGIGQCFAPDLMAPLLTQLPFAAADGTMMQSGPGRESWTAQMPVYMAPKHVAELRALRGLRFDSAFEDEFSHIPIATRALSRVLDSLGVEHTFEMYNGDHRNRLWGEDGRLFTVALPYFSRLLTDATARRGNVLAAAPVSTATGVSLAEAQEMLWDAARRGDVRRAGRALEAGAQVSAMDTLSSEAGASGRRALNFAALHNRAAMVKWLVERGAEVNRPNKTGFTALHHAAESGAVNSAEALLAAGADPNVKLPSGSTPLAVARQRKQGAMVRLLETVTKQP